MTRNDIAVLDTGHVHSAAVCAAFAEGAGVSALQPPWWIPAPASERPSEGTPSGVTPRTYGGGRRSTRAVFVYGKLRGTLAAVRFAITRGIDWYAADNGYVGGGHYAGFYRVTCNAWQLGPRAPGLPPDRARALGLGAEILPWRTSGREILVCPTLDVYDRVMGFDGEAWLAGVRAVLARASGRPVRVRYRPGDSRRRDSRTLAEDLAAAFVLVTHDSNVAVEALLAGVPVCVTGDSPAARLGLADPARIESPVYPDDRAGWLAWLAANQWTLAEMRAGKCLADLRAVERIAAA